MNGVSDGKYVCGVVWPRLRSNQMLQRHLLPTQALNRRPRILIPEPRTAEAYMDWLGLVGVMSLVIVVCMCVFEKSSKPDMALFTQAAYPPPRLPRLVALHGTVHWPPDFIGGKSQVRLFN